MYIRVSFSLCTHAIYLAATDEMQTLHSPSCSPCPCLYGFSGLAGTERAPRLVKKEQCGTSAGLDSVVCDALS